MHIFAQKPKATQPSVPAKNTESGQSKSGQNREVNSIVHLQRTIGNQAMLQLLRQEGPLSNRTLSLPQTPDGDRSPSPSGALGSFFESAERLAPETTRQVHIAQNALGQVRDLMAEARDMFRELGRRLPTREELAYYEENFLQPAQEEAARAEEAARTAERYHRGAVERGEAPEVIETSEHLVELAQEAAREARFLSDRMRGTIIRVQRIRAGLPPDEDMGPWPLPQPWDHRD